MKEYIMQFDEELYNKETGEVCFNPKAAGELIRCKDCAWHSGTQHCVQFGLVGFEENDFCSYAERKEK